MDSIIVNFVEEEEGVTRSVTIDNKTVLENLTIIYGKDMVTALIFKTQKEGFPDFYIFDKYAQFVTYLQHRKGLGFSLEFIDFHDNVDSALDRYLRLKEKDWEQPERDKIMRLFQEIVRDKTEKVTLELRQIF